MHQNGVKKSMLKCICIVLVLEPKWVNMDRLLAYLVLVGAKNWAAPDKTWRCEDFLPDSKNAICTEVECCCHVIQEKHGRCWIFNFDMNDSDLKRRACHEPSAECDSATVESITISVLCICHISYMMTVQYLDSVLPVPVPGIGRNTSFSIYHRKYNQIYHTIIHHTISPIERHHEVTAGRTMVGLEIIGYHVSIIASVSVRFPPKAPQLYWP